MGHDASRSDSSELKSSVSRVGRGTPVIPVIMLVREAPQSSSPAVFSTDNIIEVLHGEGIDNEVAKGVDGVHGCWELLNVPLEEFSERWEVDRYLSASGYLGDNTHPYFVALPKDRGAVSNEEFRRQISNVDTEVLRHLRENVVGGYNEEKFGSFIGFNCLKQ